MKTVIIVSKCLRVTKFGPGPQLYEFHFKGVYAGENLKKVMLKGGDDMRISKGEEYLIYLKVETVREGTLFGQLIKVKMLDDCWDRS